MPYLPCLPMAMRDARASLLCRYGAECPRSRFCPIRFTEPVFFTDTMARAMLMPRACLHAFSESNRRQNRNHHRNYSYSGASSTSAMRSGAITRVDMLRCHAAYDVYAIYMAAQCAMLRRFYAAYAFADDAAQLGACHCRYAPRFCLPLL